MANCSKEPNESGLSIMMKLNLGMMKTSDKYKRLTGDGGAVSTGRVERQCHTLTRVEVCADFGLMS